MADRTGVSLFLRNEVVEIAESLTAFKQYEYESRWPRELVTEYEYREVNWGELRVALELAKEGMPSYYLWGRGGQYGPGTCYHYFDAEGKRRMLELGEEYNNPPIKDLMGLIDKPDRLREYIVGHHKSRIAPVIDAEQIYYGKIYRMKKLIDPHWDQ